VSTTVAAVSASLTWTGSPAQLSAPVYTSAHAGAAVNTGAGDPEGAAEFVECGQDGGSECNRGCDKPYTPNSTAAAPRPMASPHCDELDI
jgi:hypothetical protein